MKTKFIAEVSSNHHRDLERCYEFIQKSAEIGCDAVKFQLFKIDEMFAPEILEKSEKHRIRRQWELPVEFLPKLKDCCNEHNIEFSCTPFYLAAVNELAPYVDFFKIASYELLWPELLKACAQTKIPIVISVGMATIEEIDKAIETLKTFGATDITLLHCVSAYPTPPNECNLAVLATLRERYGVKVGWSDHTVSPAVLYRAIHHWGAETVEFHIDLDGNGDEYSAGHCWLPGEIGQVIQDMNIALVADGNANKQVAASELPDRRWRADPSDGLRPYLSERINFEG